MFKSRRPQNGGHKQYKVKPYEQRLATFVTMFRVVTVFRVPFSPFSAVI